MVIKGAPAEYDTQTWCLLWWVMFFIGFLWVTRPRCRLLSVLLTQMLQSSLIMRELLCGSQKIKFSKSSIFILTEVPSETTFFYSITDATKFWAICSYFCNEILAYWNLAADKVNHFSKTIFLVFFFYFSDKLMESTIMDSNRHLADGLELKK